MTDQPTTPRRPRITHGHRTDRLMGDVLRLEQVWSDREDRERWIVHQIHRADREVTLRHIVKGRRLTLTFREMLAGYALVLNTGKSDR